MNTLGKLTKRVECGYYVVHKGEMSFYIYLFGQMVYHKPQFFLTLTFEGCAF